MVQGVTSSIPSSWQLTFSLCVACVCVWKKWKISFIFTFPYLPTYLILDCYGTLELNCSFYKLQIPFLR